MNREHTEGNWNTFSGLLQANWSHLTEDELTTIRERLDLLASRVEKRHNPVREFSDLDYDYFYPQF